MLKWAKMTNPLTQRELERLEIDTREEELPPKLESRRLWGRLITFALPVNPPWWSSVTPITAQIPPTIKHSRQNQRDPTPLPRSYIKQKPECSGGLDTTDADSISQGLQFVTEQLKKRHRLGSEIHDMTSLQSTTPTPHFLNPRWYNEQNIIPRQETPLSEGDYVTHQRPASQDPPENLSLNLPLFLREM